MRQGLTAGAGTGIIRIEKGAATSGWLFSRIRNQAKARNRHLAEWRFLRFLMMIVTVKLPMCIVIRMVSPPFGKCGQPPAVVVQRLAAEAALPVYHNSTGFARVALIYKKRPEPKFGSLFGAEDGTFPRTKKQSTGLFFAACGWPCCSSPQLRIPNKNPHGGVRHGDLCLVRKMGLEPTRHRHTHLKRACLPIPALPQIAFDCKKDSSTFGGIKSSPILQLFPAWGAPVKSQHLFLCTVPKLAKIVCA